MLLDGNGTVKVADFGLSRIKTHTFLTTQHVEVGTAAYMAPEAFGSQRVTEKARSALRMGGGCGMARNRK